MEGHGAGKGKLGKLFEQARGLGELDPIYVELSVPSH